MSLTYSSMMPLGTLAPDFKLPDSVSWKEMSLSELKSEKATVVMFICNHCPYVIHIQEQMVDIASHYKSHGVQFIAISSNDVINYPADAPDKMKEVAVNMEYSFPYLYDETQEVAKAYGAECTPDFFVFDGNLKCTYRGRMDESSPGNGKPNDGADLRNAIDATLKGNEIITEQFPSMGCNIKWK